jgi:hypothetical protein
LKVELKKVHVSRRGSEETTRFDAELYIDGKYAAVVSNDGHGGCHHFLFSDRDLEQRFYAYARSLPPVKTEFGMMDMDDEMLVDELLSRYEEEKQLKRWCKKSTVIRLKGSEEGSYQQFPEPFSAAMKGFLVNRYGDQLEEIVNERFAQTQMA